VFGVAHVLHERQNITRRRQEVRATSHQLNPYKCGYIRWLVHEDYWITIKDIAAIGNVSYVMFFAI
jgi:hypothetical protein